jgi:hypothetical protein
MRIQSGRRSIAWYVVCATQPRVKGTIAIYDFWTMWALRDLPDNCRLQEEV